MPIRFRCDSCDSRIKVPDGTEGRRVRCPRCGHLQRVPAESVEASDNEQPEADAPAEASAQAVEPHPAPTDGLDEPHESPADPAAASPEVDGPGRPAQEADDAPHATTGDAPAVEEPSTAGEAPERPLESLFDEAQREVANQDARGPIPLEFDEIEQGPISFDPPPEADAAETTDRRPSADEGSDDAGFTRDTSDEEPADEPVERPAYESANRSVGLPPATDSVGASDAAGNPRAAAQRPSPRVEPIPLGRRSAPTEPSTPAAEATRPWQSQPSPPPVAPSASEGRREPEALSVLGVLPWVMRLLAVLLVVSGGMHLLILRNDQGPLTVLFMSVVVWLSAAALVWCVGEIAAAQFGRDRR